MKKEIYPPINVGDVLKLGVIGFGNNGDPMMKLKNYILFLKNTKGKSFQLNVLLDVKVVKIFPKFGIIELI